LDVLVEGTVQKLDQRLRITARLVDVHTGRLVWAETYDARSDDPGAAQEVVAQAVAAEVGKRLSGP
jgi:adenylate cyclase